MEKEIWKDIEGYKGLYQVSNLGRVKSLDKLKKVRNNGLQPIKEKILRNRYNEKGYSIVCLCKNGEHKDCRVHRLVASAFIPNPNNLPQVNHKDENPKNNCVDNLEWCTAQYNSTYGTRIERITEKNRIRILQFTKQGEFICKWDSAREIERELGFSHQGIGMCCKGKCKSVYGYKWRYHYKSLWEKKHIPLIKQKKVA